MLRTWLLLGLILVCLAASINRNNIESSLRHHASRVSYGIRRLLPSHGSPVQKSVEFRAGIFQNVEQIARDLRVQLDDIEVMSIRTWLDYNDPEYEVVPSLQEYTFSVQGGPMRTRRTQQGNWRKMINRDDPVQKAPREPIPLTRWRLMSLSTFVRDYPRWAEKANVPRCAIQRINEFLILVKQGRLLYRVPGIGNFRDQSVDVDMQKNVISNTRNRRGLVCFGG